VNTSRGNRRSRRAARFGGTVPLCKMCRVLRSEDESRYQKSVQAMNQCPQQISRMVAATNVLASKMRNGTHIYPVGSQPVILKGLGRRTVPFNRWTRSTGRLANVRSLVPLGLLACGLATNEVERESDGSRWKLLLRRSQIRGYRFAGGHGLLSLQFLSLVVRRACQRLQPLETGCCAGHVGSRTCDHVPEDPAQPASVLR
jgi:hypothetical protein